MSASYGSNAQASVKTAGGAPAAGSSDEWLNAQRARDEQRDRERDIEAAGGPYSGDKDFAERRGSALLSDGVYAGPHTDALRKGFLRKVYGVLSAQMLLTVAVCAVAMYNTAVRGFCVSHGGALMLTAAISSVVLLISLFCYKHHHPLNLQLLGGFTLAVSVELGVVCAVYESVGAGSSVLLAAALTLSVFLALTAYTHQSAYDFSWLGAGLGACLWVLLVWGVINALFGFQPQFVYSLFGAVVFSLFIVFDTYMITRKYGYDDWAEAAVELYLDVVNLFLYVLQLISKLTRDN